MEKGSFSPWFDVRSIPGKGSGCVATRKIAKGTVVLRCDPLFAVLQPDVCDWCWSWRERCIKCRACCARFCSNRCLELARSQHHCGLFAGCASNDEDEDDVRTVLLVHELRKQGKAKQFDEDLCWQSELDVGFLARVAEKASRAMKGDVTAQDVERILGKVRSNSFGIDAPMPEGEFGESGEPDVNFLGSASYVEASFFNHTCEPANVVRVRENRRLSFIAVRNVEEGEELCITYINSARHKDNVERQALLHALYLFHCSCRVCVGEMPPIEKQCSKCGCCEFVEELCCVCEPSKIMEMME
jgi:hypothetical protein